MKRMNLEHFTINSGQTWLGDGKSYRVWIIWFLIVAQLILEGSKPDEMDLIWKLEPRNPDLWGWQNSFEEEVRKTLHKPWYRGDFCHKLKLKKAARRNYFNVPNTTGGGRPTCRQTYRWTNPHIVRQTDPHTYRPTDRETDRHECLFCQIQQTDRQTWMF